MGAVAGLVTPVLTQPFDTVKTRSQAAEVTTTIQAVTSVLKEDGIRGFWRGTVMRLSRTVFSGGESELMGWMDCRELRRY